MRVLVSTGQRARSKIRGPPSLFGAKNGFHAERETVGRLVFRQHRLAVWSSLYRAHCKPPVSILASHLNFGRRE